MRALSGLVMLLALTAEFALAAGAGPAVPNDPFLRSKGSWGQSFPDQWGLHRIGFAASGSAASAWDIVTQSTTPIIVAVIDTGLDYFHPDLKPEKSLGLDAAVEQSLFNDRLHLSAGYFWNRFQNLIQFASGGPLCPPGSFGFCPINITDAKTQGWEFSFRLALFKGLEVRGQYTYTLTRAFDSPTLALGGDKRLPRWPVDQGTVGFSYSPIEALRLDIDYRFVGNRHDNLGNSPARALGTFNVVNLAASYSVTKNWQAYVRVDNLFNETYEEIFPFGTPIRSIYGGVRMNYDLPL